MSRKDTLLLRRALFLEGLSRGLEAVELHEFINDGLRLAELARFLNREKKKEIRAAG